MQRLAGTQDEPAGDVALRAGVGGTFELLPMVGKGIKPAWRALRGTKVGSQMTSALKGFNKNELATLLKEVKDRDGITFPDLMNFQKSDSPVLRKLADQTRQFSRKAQKRVAAQLSALADVAAKAAPTLNTPSTADEIVQRGMRKYYKETKEALGGRAIEATDAGERFIQGVTEGLDTRKEGMQTAFQKLDDVVANQNPTFDNTGAKTAAMEWEQFGMVDAPAQLADIFPKGAEEASGATAFKAVRGYINAADTPKQKLARINGVLARLNSVQDYATLRELRSQVGSLLNLPLAKKMESGLDIGQTKRLYSELSKALEAPQGLIPAAEKVYKRRLAESTQAALKYYDSYDQAQIGQALLAKQGQTPTTLFNSLANNPAAIERGLRDLLREAKNKPEVLGTIKNNLQSVIMSADDPQAVLRTWQKSNAETTRWLFDNPRKLAIAERNAAVLTDLNQGPAREAADAAFTRTRYAMNLLEDSTRQQRALGGTPRRQAQSLVASLGGPKSEPVQALRTAVFTDAIEESLRQHAETGVWALDPSVLRDRVKAFQRSGWWDTILTPRDRRVITALEKFSDKAWKTGGAGTGLAVAAQIGQARQGDIGALLSLRIAHNMGNYLTDTRIIPEQLMRFVPKGEHPLTSKAMHVAATAVRQGLAQSYSESLRNQPQGPKGQHGVPRSPNDPPKTIGKDAKDYVKGQDQVDDGRLTHYSHTSRRSSSSW